jgi:hypothetical protein
MMNESLSFIKLSCFYAFIQSCFRKWMESAKTEKAKGNLMASVVIVLFRTGWDDENGKEEEFM